jgi:hypothetical protein
MKVCLIVLVISSHVFAVGEVFWLTKIFHSAKEISDKAGDFRKSVKIAEDLKIIESEQSKEMRYQSKFMKDVDQSDSVIDYIDRQVKVDHDTIKTLDALYDASELTDKYFGYSPYEDTYIPYSEATLQTINDALADPEKAKEMDSQDAHNKMSAHQSSKMIIEQAKTNDLLGKIVANNEKQHIANIKATKEEEEKRMNRSNDERVFFSKFRRFAR